MARLIGAYGCSHGPLLTTPPDLWHLREGVDRRNPRHAYRGAYYDFPGLLAARGASFATQLAPELKQQRYDACQRGVAELARRFRASKPDLAIMIGNDQRELFQVDFTPAVLVYAGSTIPNIYPPEEEHERLAEMGLLVSAKGHAPLEAGRLDYPGAPEVATALIASLIDRDFDVAMSEVLPKPNGRDFGIPHAFGFLFRRIMEDAPPPTVPIFINVGEGPNQPRLHRLLAFGHALKAAIDALPGDLTVALFSSGGLSHFTIDEEFDEAVMRAMRSGDEAALVAFPESWFWGNTCETKSWYPTVAAMNDCGREIDIIDYVPCYRSEAGTGQAMIFATW